MPKFLTQFKSNKQLCVLGLGKASVKMAEVVNQYFGDQCYGAVVTRHGYTKSTRIGNIKVLFGSHPVPDESSVNAAHELLKIASQAPKDIPVLFLISGGGSALASMPIEGLNFAEKIKINKQLLANGARIDEINLVRKSLSAIKGGKLSKLIKGEHHTLAISDVVGDDIEVIASGPTIPHNIDVSAVLDVLTKYGYRNSTKIEHLLNQQQSKLDEQVPPTFDIVANARQSIDAAASFAKQRGWQVEVLSYEQQGEATAVGKHHAQLIKNKFSDGHSYILLSGGELTVSLNNLSGAGGPNQEYLLSLAIALEGQSKVNVYALACDTDGVDGNKDVAGAVITPTTLQRAKNKGINAKVLLKSNQSYHFFQQLNNLVISGPTHTNVNDFRAILIEAE